MAVITLLTDFGREDYYTSVFKGELYKACPSSIVVDLTHSIPAYSINKAAYFLKNTFTHFPEGSLHIARVYETSSKEENILLVKYQQHYFAAPDNGLLSMVFEQETPSEVYVLNKEICRDLSLDQMYSKVARTIVFNGSIHEIGIPIKEIVERLVHKPVIYENRINGVVLHVDHFGNVITNISRGDFNLGVKGRQFEINFRRQDKINELSKNYADVPEGDKLALFNDKDYLEIAINVGEASSLLGLGVGDRILIEVI